MRILLVATLLVLPALSGCTFFGDLVDEFNRPDLSVSRTALDNTNAQGYITEPLFSVAVIGETADVAIMAKAQDGRTISAEGIAGPSQRDLVSITLEDGTWDVSYTVAGYEWETFRKVKVDATPPLTDGIETFGQGTDRAFTLGQGYTPEAGVKVEVRDAQGQLIAQALPHRLEGLSDGIHFFLILLTDAAGNQASLSVQVAAGEAKKLPDGQFTFGIVARYTNQARLWDLSRMDDYLTPGEARQALQGQWLGDSYEYGIEKDHPDVIAVVDNVLQPSDDTTMEIAWRLYHWLYDNLEYDDARLDSSTLMLPHQVISDSEDPDAETGPGGDAGDDGLADDGAGNGVRGGVCRDLAGTYVSLLRAAGVPARLVSGYLAGNVDGFHAWVEFYAGNLDGNPGPWVPVDVSPIDGAWDDDTPSNGVPDGLETSLQSFGIQLPQYLALRKIPDPYERAGWSTALGTQFQYPQSSTPPKVTFEKDVTDIGSPTEGVLCFNDATLQRTLAQRPRDCAGGSYYIGRDPNDSSGRPFITGTRRVIDYGMQVTDAGSGTTITMTLSYPFNGDVDPDTVEWAPYGNIPRGYKFSQEDPDVTTGKIKAVMTR